MKNPKPPEPTQEIKPTKKPSIKLNTTLEATWTSTETKELTETNTITITIKHAETTLATLTTTLKINEYHEKEYTGPKELKALTLHTIKMTTPQQDHTNRYKCTRCHNHYNRKKETESKKWCPQCYEDLMNGKP